MEEGFGNGRGISSLLLDLLSGLGAFEITPGSVPIVIPGPGRLMRDGSEGLVGIPDPNL
jgi:hypothetical protein